jgi:hypothetical protein
LLGCSRSDHTAPEASAIDHPIAAEEHASPNPAVAMPDVRKTIAKPERTRTTDLRHVPEQKRVLPHVELDAGEWAKHHFEIIMHAEEWKGCTFRGIISPSSVTRIIRLRDDGFTSGDQISAHQRYDALMDHLIESDEKARDYGLLDLESPVATLVLLTKDGKIYLLSALVNILSGRISAINISGHDKGARIEVKGYEPNPSPRHLR